MQILENQLIIQNFPSHYPLYKRIASNLTYFFSQIPSFPRENALTKKEIKTVKKQVQTGDILLVGDFKHISGLMIEGVVTHACSYLQQGRCIHAYAQGVSIISLRRILRKYDTLILLRPRWRDEQQKIVYCNELVSKLGKPYDFYFGIEDESELFFCTKLINDSLKKSEYDTGLDSVRPVENIVDEFLDTTVRFHRVLKPADMVLGKFDVIFSSNLIKKGGAHYIFKKPLGKIPL